jgi:hypothetical protein
MEGSADVVDCIIGDIHASTMDFSFAALATYRLQNWRCLLQHFKFATSNAVSIEYTGDVH